MLYPQDGYWRARPLPPANLKWSAYGSSFLVGPIEIKERPFVDIKEVVFDPDTKTFRLQFTRGGSATLRLETLDIERQVLDVTLDPPVGGDLPFAALRSMFVTEINNDVAHLGWRLKGAQSWERQPIMDFKRASAVEVWAGRLVPSRHNTSAPDMVFRGFQGRARSFPSAALLLQLPPRPAQRLEREAHGVLSRRHLHGAEDHIGAQDLGLDAVDRRAPPRMPDVVEQQHAAGRRIDLDDDFGVGVAHEARGAGSLEHGERRQRAASFSSSTVLVRIDIGRPAVRRSAWRSRRPASRRPASRAAARADSRRHRHPWCAR